MINCSFGNSTLEASESSALDNAQNNGVVVACAAGNNEPTWSTVRPRVGQRTPGRCW